MPKRIPPLTDQAIKKAKYNPDKTLDNSKNTLFDGNGLYLLLTPSGGKLWRFKYRYAGKGKLLALGSYPEKSLADANEMTVGIMAVRARFLFDCLEKVHPGCRNQFKKFLRILK